MINTFRVGSYQLSQRRSVVWTMYLELRSMRTTQTNSQTLAKTYAHDVLDCFNMHLAKPNDTYVAKNHDFRLECCPKNSDKRVKGTPPYTSVIKSLIHIMLCTRPNLVFIVNLLSRLRKTWVSYARLTWKEFGGISCELSTINYHLVERTYDPKDTQMRIWSMTSTCTCQLWFMFSC